MQFGKTIMTGLASAVGAIGLLAGEAAFQDDFSTPSQWSFWSWQGKNEKSGGIGSAEAPDLKQTLAIAAVQNGYAGWMSSEIDYDKKGSVAVKLKFKVSSDYAGNVPRVFVTWFQGKKHLKANFLSLTSAQLDSARKDWTEVTLQVPADDGAPAGADSIRLNLASAAKGGGKPAGFVYFSSASVEIQ